MEYPTTPGFRPGHREMNLIKVGSRVRSHQIGGFGLGTVTYKHGFHLKVQWDAGPHTSAVAWQVKLIKEVERTTVDILSVSV